MPCCRVLRVNLRRLLAKSDYTVVVLILDFESLLIGLKVLKLPRRQLLVALAQQLGVQLLRVGQHYLKLACRAVARVVLVVNVIGNRNLDLSHVVSQLALLVLDHKLRHALLLFFLEQHFLAFLQVLLERGQDSGA